MTFFQCSSEASGPISVAGSFGSPSGQRLGGGDEPGHELVVDAALHEQPRAGQADLPGVAEDRLDRPGDGVVEVGVVEDQVGALAAQLEADRGEVGRRGLADHARGRGLAGEGDPVDAAVLGQRRARGVRSEAVHDVEDAGRQPGLGGQPGQQGRGLRGVLGGLEHHRVAPGQGGRDLPRLEHQREVPGRDRGDDSGRLEQRVGVVTAVHRERLARPPAGRGRRRTGCSGRSAARPSSGRR